MEIIAQPTLLRPTERWRRRPITWLAVAGISFGVAIFSAIGGNRTAAVVFLALGGACFAGSALLTARRLRAARAEMAAMIDAHLASRAVDQRQESDEDTRKRAAILAFRQRI